MRFDILKIYQDGERWYEVTVYHLTPQPPEFVIRKEFKYKTDMWKFINKHLTK